MNIIERNSNELSVGYESLVWVNDDQGHEFSCSLDSQRPNVTKFEQLTEHEKQTCLDVNQLVGTERW